MGLRQTHLLQQTIKAVLSRLDRAGLEVQSEKSSCYPRISDEVGRLTFPTCNAAATLPSTTDAKALKLRPGRTGLDVKSEKWLTFLCAAWCAHAPSR